MLLFCLRQVLEETVYHSVEIRSTKKYRTVRLNNRQSSLIAVLKGARKKSYVRWYGNDSLAIDWCNNGWRWICMIKMADCKWSLSGHVWRMDVKWFIQTWSENILYYVRESKLNECNINIIQCIAIYLPSIWLSLEHACNQILGMLGYDSETGIHFVEYVGILT